MNSTPKTTPETYLEINNLSKSFGSFHALDDISLTVNNGDFVCFLGPSGCGKTTLLRCIAGLETQTTGSISQKKTDVSTLPPSSRDFGIVFQSYALFPNLSVFSNISYGLINKKWTKDAISDRVTGLLDMVGLQGHAQKYPSQLSGGEQQRVALARALATSPGLLLLDEPLSALDAKVRIHLRKQIKDLHRSLGLTTIMVTHDQEEAQSMADVIFVMKDGAVVQSGSPRDIYEKANSPFIANFIGITNFIDATILSVNHARCGETNLRCNGANFAVGSSVQLAIRPEYITLAKAEESAENRVSGHVADIEFLGSFQRLHITVPALANAVMMVDISNVHGPDAGVAVGQLVTLDLPSQAIIAYADV
jgi:iron(III) transport system ATP-binding protein